MYSIGVRRFSAGCAIWLALFVGTTSAQADVTLIGSGKLPGDGTDLSGLTDVLSGGVPHNRLGGISAIEYLGEGDRYVLLPDRGPIDGGTGYKCRYHVIQLPVMLPKAGAAISKLQPEVVSTTLLRNEAGKNFVGATAAFDVAHPEKTLRFDPEGVRLGAQRTLFISDEYGPFVYEFAESGKRLRALPIPARFQALHPAATPEAEASENHSGRQPNGGMEGVAITPDGKKLFAAMQRPLIQDSMPGTKGKRVGIHNRILEIDVAAGATREYVYELDDTVNGISEILAVNDHNFLVIERDGKAGTEAVAKKIYQADISKATDISKLDNLAATKLPEGVTAARKTLLLDLLDSRFGLSRENAPEKVEGLAFGPTLADGRFLLIVAIDNDFKVEVPISLHAFAIDPADLPEFGWKR